eukprot:scaffold17153_cov107-Isochrysis_galbana.AAC.2
MATIETVDGRHGHLHVRLQQRNGVTPSSNVVAAECNDRKDVLLRRVDVFFDVLLHALEGARRDAVQ